MNIEMPTDPRQTGRPLGVLALLLAGLLGLWGVCFQTRAERAAYRELAYRVRRTVSNVERTFTTRENNKAIIADWSDDGRPYWFDCVRSLWLGAPCRFWSVRNARVLRVGDMAMATARIFRLFPCGRFIKPP